MGILRIFKSKIKSNEKSSEELNLPDDEYQLPVLKRGDFEMTEELRRRQEDEQLIKCYNIVLKKEGKFL